MFTLNLALLILCANYLVKSNPVYQRQPRQSCPVHGQPSFHQQPTNPHNQPYPLNYHGHQPQCGRPNNFNPQASVCHQSSAQHQQPSKSCQQPSPVYQLPQQPSAGCQRTNNHASTINNLGLPLNNDLGQYLVERLFSNPVFRDVLNKNQPVTVPLENKHPNVVNNYFIVPKDLFLNNTECIKELQSPKDASKGRRRLDGDGVKNTIRNKAEKHSKTEMVDIPPEIRIVASGHQFNYPEEYNYNREHRERPAKAIKARTMNGENSATIDNNFTSINNKTKINNTNDRNRESQNLRKPKSKEPKISFLSDEYILNDFKRKFPHTSDETAKNIIKQMKLQVQKQYSNYVDTNQSPIQYLVRKKSHNSENNQRNSTKARKTSKNHQGTVNNVTKTSLNETHHVTEAPIQEVNSSPENTIENLKERITSTEASKLDTTTEGLKKYKPETTDNTTPLTINGHHNARLPELGAEDTMPNIDENDLIGEIDFPDYYPDFNFDNHAYHLEALEEYANDNVQRNERKVDHHHETMLNAETRPNINRRMGRKLRRQRIGKGNRNREQLKQTKAMPEENVLVVATYANDANNEGEEIVFQIPPGLESPDFETIQLVAINDDEDFESEKYAREHYDKYSTYSEIKNGETMNPANEIKKVKVTKPRDLGNSDIETVFATSRVVNYANDLAFQETVTVKNSVIFAGDGIFPITSDGAATTLVVARSYDDSGDNIK